MLTKSLKATCSWAQTLDHALCYWMFHLNNCEYLNVDRWKSYNLTNITRMSGKPNVNVSNMLWWYFIVPLAFCMYVVLVKLCTLLHNHCGEDQNRERHLRSLQGGSLLKDSVLSWRHGKSFTEYIIMHTRCLKPAIYTRDEIKTPQHVVIIYDSTQTLFALSCFYIS